MNRCSRFSSFEPYPDEEPMERVANSRPINCNTPVVCKQFVNSSQTHDALANNCAADQWMPRCVRIPRTLTVIRNTTQKTLKKVIKRLLTREIEIPTTQQRRPAQWKQQKRVSNRLHFCLFGSDPRQQSTPAQNKTFH